MNNLTQKQVSELSKLKLKKGIADFLKLDYEIDSDECLMVLERPPVSTMPDNFQEINTVDNGTRILAIEFDPVDN